MAPRDPTISIEIDLDVYEYLKTRSTFEDTVSSVLRRELGLTTSQPVDDEVPPPPAADRAAPASRTRSGGSARAQRSRRSRPKGTRAAAGTLLPEAEYHRPILEILVENGGSAPKQTVIEEVGRRLQDLLTEEDQQPLESGGIRWQSRAQFARLRLVDRGLMDKSAPRGTWAITPDGEKALREGTL